MSLRSNQKREERTIVFEIKITVWTDHMQRFLTETILGVIKAMRMNEESQRRKTIIKVKERVLNKKGFGISSRELLNND